MNALLEGIKNLRKDFLNSLLYDQQWSEPYINKYCMDCKYHEIIDYNNKDIHICNDIWSFASVGKHIFYCETQDMCIEYKGFKNKI
jgi:hypothetical protein